MTKMVLGGTARGGDRATFSRLGRGGPLSCFFISSLLSGKKRNARKNLILLSSGRPLKCQNTQNRRFLFCRVITKIRGSGKSP
jgi:hypothetical protein